MEDTTYKIRIDQDDFSAQMQALAGTVTRFLDTIATPINTVLGSLGGGIGANVGGVMANASHGIAQGAMQYPQAILDSARMAKMRTAATPQVYENRRSSYAFMQPSLWETASADMGLDAIMGGIKDMIPFSDGGGMYRLESRMDKMTSDYAPWITSAQAAQTYQENAQLSRVELRDRTGQFFQDAGAGVLGGTAWLATSAIPGLAGPMGVGALAGIAKLGTDVMFGEGNIASTILTPFAKVGEYLSRPSMLVDESLRSHVQLADYYDLASSIKTVSKARGIGSSSSGAGMSGAEAVVKAMDIEDIVMDILMDTKGSTVGRQSLMELSQGMINQGILDPFSPAGEFKKKLKNIIKGGLHQWMVALEQGPKEAIASMGMFSQIARGTGADVDQMMTAVGITSRMTGFSSGSLMQRGSQMGVGFQGSGFNATMGMDITNMAARLAYGGFVTDMNPRTYQQIGGVPGFRAILEKSMVAGAQSPYMGSVVASAFDPKTGEYDSGVYVDYLTGKTSIGSTQTSAGRNLKSVEDILGYQYTSGGEISEMGQDANLAMTRRSAVEFLDSRGIPVTRLSLGAAFTSLGYTSNKWDGDAMVSATDPITRMSEALSADLKKKSIAINAKSTYYRDAKNQSNTGFFRKVANTWSYFMEDDETRKEQLRKSGGFWGFMGGNTLDDTKKYYRDKLKTSTNLAMATHINMNDVITSVEDAKEHDAIMRTLGSENSYFEMMGGVDNAYKYASIMNSEEDGGHALVEFADIGYSGDMDTITSTLDQIDTLTNTGKLTPSQAASRMGAIFGGKLKNVNKWNYVKLRGKHGELSKGTSNALLLGSMARDDATRRKYRDIWAPEVMKKLGKKAGSLFIKKYDALESAYKNQVMGTMLSHSNPGTLDEHAAIDNAYHGVIPDKWESTHQQNIYANRNPEIGSNLNMTRNIEVSRFTKFFAKQEQRIYDMNKKVFGYTLKGGESSGKENTPLYDNYDYYGELSLAEKGATPGMDPMLAPTLSVISKLRSMDRDDVRTIGDRLTKSAAQGKSISTVLNAYGLSEDFNKVSRLRGNVVDYSRSDMGMTATKKFMISNTVVPHELKGMAAWYNKLVTLIDDPNIRTLGKKGAIQASHRKEVDAAKTLALAHKAAYGNAGNIGLLNDILGISPWDGKGVADKVGTINNLGGMSKAALEDDYQELLTLIKDKKAYQFSEAALLVRDLVAIKGSVGDKASITQKTWGGLKLSNSVRIAGNKILAKSDGTLPRDEFINKLGYDDVIMNTFKSQKYIKQKIDDKLNSTGEVNKTNIARTAAATELMAVYLSGKTKEDEKKKIRDEIRTGSVTLGGNKQRRNI